MFRTLFYIYDKNKYKYTSIAILCQEDLVEALLKHICTTSTIEQFDFIINYLNFDSEDYDNEYIFILSIDDGMLLLSIEKAKHDNNEYKTLEEDFVYISDECNSELILRQTAYEGDMDIFSIGEEYEE